MKPRIYLADLRHNYTGVLSNDCMPLGVAYMKAVMDRDLPEVESRLFAYPDPLWHALRDEPPDILMLSNYMWNEWLSFKFAELAKRVSPETLVVMGGPNICIEPERQIAYLEAHPEIDVYVLGEGDFLAREVARAWLASASLEAFREQALPSCLFRDRDGRVVRSETWDRQKQVEEIPSPWLTGVLDEFFDGKLAPLLETNRGCPFSCTFCVQGTRWYTKVHYFDKDRIEQEIRYIAQRIHDVCPSMGFLRIADSNYGMYERDAEISEWIGEAQAAFGWPTFIDATTGKNRPDRVIQSLEKTGGALVLYQAVQSLDERTLKNIKRANISQEAYDQIMIHVRGRGLRSLSDLILGLPGERLESHLKGVAELIDSGTHELHLFQAMLLKGSELEMQRSRDEAQMETRFRVLPKNFGIYGGEMVFDVDEIVVATDTMSFDDYVVARKHALASSIFQNNSWLEDAVEFTRSLGLARSEWFFAMADALREADGEVGELVEGFERETREELFRTRDELVAFYSQPENFARLEAGEIGDNLMYKYRANASFFVWPAICRMGMAATRKLLEDRALDTEIPDFGVFWDDLTRFVEARHAHGTTQETILAPVKLDLRHDLPAWVAAGRPADVARFRLASPTPFVAALPEDSVREIRGLFDVWTTSLMGLTKGITRIRAEAQVRVCRSVEPEACVA
jgi:radical SAM superfamily enzyme YgiQ (UPF0313 family)